LVEVPGVRPATFKLIERGPDSYELYRSSRKLGTARKEDRGEWTASFEALRKSWKANAKSADALLKLVGTFLLANDARASAARPVGEIDPALKVKGRMDAEQKLSLKFAERAQERRLEELDALIKECRKSIRAG
jgi:hypothetical protein